MWTDRWRTFETSLARNLECNAMLRQPATDIGSIDLIA